MNGAEIDDIILLPVNGELMVYMFFNLTIPSIIPYKIISCLLFHLIVYLFVLLHIIQSVKRSDLFRAQIEIWVP